MLWRPDPEGTSEYMPEFRIGWLVKKILDGELKDMFADLSALDSQQIKKIALEDNHKGIFNCNLGPFGIRYIGDEGFISINLKKRKQD